MNDGDEKKDGSLKEAVDAQEKWVQSEDWYGDSPEADEDWSAALANLEDAADEPAAVLPGSGTLDQAVEALVQATATLQAEGRRAPDIAVRLDALGQGMARLTAAVTHLPAASPGPMDIPAWLLAVAGDPRAYDAPDPTRTGVQARVYLRTYQRLKHVQTRLGLRTLAGAWECVLQWGLAVAERMPVR